MEVANYNGDQMCFLSCRTIAIEFAMQFYSEDSSNFYSTSKLKISIFWELGHMAHYRYSLWGSNMVFDFWNLIHRICHQTINTSSASATDATAQWHNFETRPGIQNNMTRLTWLHYHVLCSSLPLHFPRIICRLEACATLMKHIIYHLDYWKKMLARTGIELGSLDLKSKVLTITPRDRIHLAHLCCYYLRRAWLADSWSRFHQVICSAHKRSCWTSVDLLKHLSRWSELCHVNSFNPWSTTLLET